MAVAAANRGELADAIAARQWYHTLELAPGLSTPGWFDLRGLPERIGLPGDLAGKRCLDIGTFDGFWAFEMERRGATEVVAVDLLDGQRFDWPTGSDPAVKRTITERKGTGTEVGAGFEIARRALGSAVERRELSVYDLDPEDVGGFDFVYMGSLLLHLRDPVRGLERVRGVCRERLLICDAIDPRLARLHPRLPVAWLDGVGRPWWWKPNPAALVRMAEAAGFAVLSGPTRVRLRPGAGQSTVPLRQAVRGLASRQGRAAGFSARLGDPHCALLLRPVAPDD